MESVGELVNTLFFKRLQASRDCTHIHDAVALTNCQALMTAWQESSRGMRDQSLGSAIRAGA
jgi:hypothetical protein